MNVYLFNVTILYIPTGCGCKYRMLYSVEGTEMLNLKSRNSRKNKSK